MGKSLTGLLESWYGREARDLPWRRTSDSYAIWISEAMLQQTRVEAVIGYWLRFLERFPDVNSLAAADEQAVLEAWSGLGYYRRARALQASAQVIVREHGGRFPETRHAALALPGVGPYTAGAVLSIAYGQREALVDGNVERVFARLFGIESVTASAMLKGQAWDLALELIAHPKNPGHWNQALMELGAVICTPRAPRCLLCPVAEHCRASASGDPARLPLPKAKKPPTPVEARMAWVTRGEDLLLEQRPAGGRMAHMWQLPTVEHVSEGAGEGLYPVDWPGGISLELGEIIGELRHSITRYALRVWLHRAACPELIEREAQTPLRWVPRAEASQLALTGLTKKAFALF